MINSFLKIIYTSNQNYIRNYMMQFLALDKLTLLDLSELVYSILIFDRNRNHRLVVLCILKVSSVAYL